MFKQISDEIVDAKTLSSESVDFLTKWGCQLARKFVVWAKEADIDDIVQTGLLGITKMIPTYDPNRAAVSTLYHRIIANAAMQWGKKANKSKMVSLDLENADGELVFDVASTAPEAPDGEQVKQAVFSCLDEREIQIGGWLADSWTQDQIAAELGITRQAVSAAIIKMRGKLERAGFVK